MYDWRIAFTGMKWKQTLTTQEISSRLRIGLAQNMGGVEKSGNKYAFFLLFRHVFYQHFKCMFEFTNFCSLGTSQ